MKKTLLFGTILFIAFAAQAQLTSILHSTRIGSSGNLLSVTNENETMLDVNPALNTIVFTHRNDPYLSPGTNVSQYRFDISKNGGLTWLHDIGPITNDPTIDNVSVNGRYPQGVIYNPAGNSIVDSAYLVYSGTWHDGNTWSGQMRGRGKLSGDTSTFNVHIDIVNNKHVEMGAGLCKGAPGVFWNLNLDYSGSFTVGANAITSGLIVQKGVWNSTTKDVDWTSVTIPQAFQTMDNGGSTVSICTAHTIAFDPTGQFGWIAVLGDITADGDSVYDPIFWKTTNGGVSWSGPIRVDLDSLQGVKNKLSHTQLNGNPTTLIPTTTYEADLAVDVNGNPHLITTVGNSTEYSVQAAGYTVWDITYDAGAITGCNWKGIHLADIQTLRGTFTNDNPATTDDNRPQVSCSPDGHKLFFFWNESDAVFLGSGDNDIPNLFGRGIDVVQNKMTPMYNFTEGDSLWGGETQYTMGGVFGGSVFPVISPTSLVNGNVNNVPLVMTQVDYNHDPSTGLGSSEQPAAQWYISNINIPSADFTLDLDQVGPSVTLNGPDTITLLLNTTYTEPGATAFDCSSGALTPVIQNSPNTAVVGVYHVLYIATDGFNNSDTAVRIVIVGASPVADFTWSFPQFPYKAQFQDQSLNLPDHWIWNFGDGSGSALKNPLKTYAANGVYNVCLVASNSFGSSQQVCKQVTITGAANSLSVSLGSNQTVCDGSQLTLNPVINGGVTPYNYAWSFTGSALSCNNCNHPSVTLTQNSVFSVTVTDAFSTTASATVSYTLSGGANLLQLSVTSTPINCANPVDTTTVTVTNGSSPFTFNWGNGSSNSGTSPQTHLYSQPGAYVISVTDAAGCVASIIDTVVDQGINITAAQVIQPQCEHQNTGKLKISAANGTAPYTYSWNTAATADSITGLQANFYSVTVTDATLCTASAGFSLSPLDGWGYYVFLTGSDANCGNTGYVTTALNHGRPPFSYLWNTSQTTSSISNLGAGNYAVTVTDSLGCTTWGSANVDAYCVSLITGMAFIDTNSNCIFNAGESPAQSTFISATRNGQTYYGITDATGYFSISVPVAGTYTLDANIYNFYYNTGCGGFTLCGNQPQTVTIATAGDTSANNNFSLNSVTNYDLSLFLRWSVGNPGFTKTYRIYPYNNSSLTFGAQATITFKYDSNLVYQASTPAAAHNPALHTLTWSVDSISWPYYYFNELQSTFMVPVSTSLTYILQSDFSISPTSGDCDTTNNHLHTSDAVTGSYDPNEKEVEPAGSILETDSVLTYTIHFQNTGTDSTHFIIVTDTLSHNVNPASVRTIASSHPYSNFSVSGEGILKWTFNPLRLVDSFTNEAGSKGFVKFTVKKKQNLPIGSVISNKAHIYFDYNEPVVTNTVQDTMSLPNYIFEARGNDGISVKAFPNPFSDITNIVVEGLNTKFDFELYDVTGRLNKRITSIETSKFELQRDELAPAVYFYRIVTSTGKGAYGKLVVQ